MDDGYSVYQFKIAQPVRYVFALALMATALAGCGKIDDGASEAAMAQSLIEQGRVAEARLMVNEAIGKNDAEPSHHLLKGRIEFKAGSTIGAFDAYQEALSLDSTNMEALQAVSQLGLQTGNLQESLKAADAILALDPSNVEALITRGLHAIIQRRYDEADDYADRILMLDSGSEGGTILKARVAFLRGDIPAAVNVLDAYEEQSEITAGIALTRLEVARERRDAEGLRRQFAALRSLLPEDAGLRIDEANFAFKSNRPQEGMTLTAERLADPNTSSEMARAAIRLWGEYGIENLPQRLLREIASSGSEPAVREVGEYLARRGLDGPARLMTARTSDSDQRAIEALIALRSRAFARADELSQSVLSRDSTHCLALTVRARVLLARSQARAALRPAQEAASQCPASRDAWMAAAAAYSALGDRENARRMWRQGMAANPQDSSLARAFVAWLLEAGKEREAVAVARRLTHDAPALLSGWRLYLETCRRVPSDCSGAAARGLADARTRYGIDLLPGEAPPNGLFGRLVRR